MIRIVAFICALASFAVAQPALDQAKAHFKQGKKYQDGGQFARAADEYKAAYELDRKPEMLFNVAQAYRLANDKPAAVDYYQRYLAAQPNGAGAAEARKHLAELGAPETRPETNLTPPVRPDPPVKPPEPPPTRPQTSSVAPPPPIETPPHDSSSSFQIAGFTAAGLGLVAIGAGVKLGLDARGAADDISKHTGPWTDADKARFEDGQHANRNMVIAYAGGGALVATGVVLVVIGRSSHVVPVVGASGAGAMVWGRF